MTSAEIDKQIATAKQYPRDYQAVLANIKQLATLDKEIAEDCFYVLRRKDASGADNIIEGLSVRFAEVVASCWGNLRTGTRIVANNGKTITAQAICHDLETNVARSMEISRRITTKSGKTFSEDMQVVTGNAASAIAFRNAVLSVIPKAFLKSIITEVKAMALGQSIDVDQRRQRMLDYFAKIGVSQEQILNYLNLESVDQIAEQELFQLGGTANAIKEGTTTVKETFIAPQEEKKANEKAEAAAKDNKAKAIEALAQATGMKPASEL
jgi:hypothetical protein